MENNINKNRYEFLKDEYPEPITIGQMRIICKISLRSAKYLLDQGIVEARISDKKSWKYQISIESVIEYLIARETKGSMIPKGILTSRKRKDGYTLRADFKICGMQGQDDQPIIREYFEYIFSDYPEILTRQDVSNMIGFHRSTILKHIRAKQIEELEQDFILKSSVLDFVCSKPYLENCSRSDNYFKILKGFELWKQKESVKRRCNQ